MKYRLNQTAAGVWLYAFITLSIALVVGLVFLNPLWSLLEPPFWMPKVIPAITAPVDGPFYLWNADFGYRWQTQNPLSLWFHPLLPFLLTTLPKWLPTNIWFWLISLAFAIG